MYTSTLSIIHISGKDSQTFLQGQITADMKSINHSQAQLAACCDLKGRVVASFLIVVATDVDGYRLVLPSDNTDTLLSHLQKYAVFSKVKLNLDNTQQAVIATDSHCSYTLPASDQYHLQIQAGDSMDSASHSHWQDYCWSTGLCLINQATSGQFIPMMLGYDKLGGISFDKGCYLGQEVIARAHYRGQIKRHLYEITLVGGEPIEPGSCVCNDQDQTVGLTVFSRINNGNQQILAVIQDIAIEGPLQIAQQTLTVINTRF